MFRANIRLVTPAADAGFAGVGTPRPESKRLTDRSHHGSAEPSRTSIGYSGARARTWASRLTVARLTARLHRNESGRRGSRTPKAEVHPFSRRDTAPDGSPSSRWPRQESNLHAPRFKRVLYLIGATTTRDGRGWSRASGLLF